MTAAVAGPVMSAEIAVAAVATDLESSTPAYPSPAPTATAHADGREFLRRHSYCVSVWRHGYTWVIKRLG